MGRRVKLKWKWPYINHVNFVKQGSKNVSYLHNIFVIKNEESGMPSDMSILSVCGVAAAAMVHCCPGLGWAAGCWAPPDKISLDEEEKQH